MKKRLSILVAVGVLAWLMLRNAEPSRLSVAPANPGAITPPAAPPATLAEPDWTA